MINWLFKWVNKLLGKNLRSTPKDVILDQMNEKRPLPIGSTEFEEWSDRIISGTLISATVESQKFALAGMLMHLKPTEDHETDAYFIKSLRKFAVNETAHAKMNELKEAQRARIEAEAKEKESTATNTTSMTDFINKKEVKQTVESGATSDDKVLEKSELQNP